MRRLYVTLTALAVCLFVLPHYSAIAADSTKSRVIVTTDLGGDPDDQESLVHMLLLSNEFDIEGIISNLAWDLRPMYVPNIRKIISAYGEVLPYLRVHGDFPSDSYLQSIVKYGQNSNGMHGVGEGKDSEGSEHIIYVVDDPSDDRPVWLTAWGGMNTIAQAIWKVSSTRPKEEAEKFFSKIRIFDILGQDDAGAWIARNFPQITYIRAVKVYGWNPDDAWFAENIQSAKPFGDRYVQRIWAWEGDSPAFFYLVDNGLNSPEHMDWGGRYSLEKTEGVRGMRFVAMEGLDETAFDPYYMHTDTEEGVENINLWRDQMLNDFAARMQWTVADRYNKANHHPVAVLDGDSSRDYLEIKARPGSKVPLDASASTDPDGNDLSFEWMFYQAPSSYKGQVSIASEGGKATVSVPTDAGGKTLHVILSVTDNGTPALTSYRRAVIHVE